MPEERPHKKNEQITEYVKEYYEESNGVLGYRQMNITINREKTEALPHAIKVKRVQRIMQILGLNRLSSSIPLTKLQDFIRKRSLSSIATESSNTPIRHFTKNSRMPA